MPIYEYRCEKCQHQFDLLQKITDEPVKECPECGGPVSKLISSTSFILKGSGWYVTDYGKGNGSKNDNGKGKGHVGESGAKNEKKKEIKPAVKDKAAAA
ncbi:MAG: zinc ribbon domain-containing protein [Deltaproteobacteria bacterium]|nr:zinc ribbon domain-containing protein [Deltaproteobacteria bacterium]